MQRETVNRLVAEASGLLIREMPDGSLEVLTERRGTVGRHSVAPDGTSLLLEARPRDWRAWGGPLVWCIGCALFVGGVIGIGVTDRGEAVAEWWTIITAFTGFALMPVGWALMPSPYKFTRRGENWIPYGFPDA